MLDTIVVPLDGSDFSARAIPYATGLARPADARLVLLRVLPHRAPGSAIDEVNAIQATLELDTRAARAEGVQVDAAVRRIRPIQAEDVARTISTFADEQRAGLIVMSTHGRGGLGRWIYGSVADSVLRHATLPVIVTSPRCERSWPGDRPLRVLVTLDGSSTAGPPSNWYATAPAPLV